jgi:hypothetical protein
MRSYLVSYYITKIFLCCYSTVAGKGDRIFVQVKYKKHPDSPMPDADVRSLKEIDLPVEALVFFCGVAGKASVCHQQFAKAGTRNWPLYIVFLRL